MSQDKNTSNNHSLREPKFYNKWRRLFLFLVTHVFYMIRFKLVYRLEVYGKENIPDDNNFIIAANHLSTLDPPLVCAVMNRPVAYMAKKELFENPFMRWWLNWLGAFAVDANCGGNGKCSENTLVNRYEMGQSQRIATLESDRYTDQKIIEAYKQSVADNKALEAKINELAERNSAAHETINRELVAQREAQLITNGKMDKELALLKQADFFNRQLNDCRYVTAKKVVAKDDICPEVMARYNSWTAPTTTANETPAG